MDKRSAVWEHFEPMLKDEKVVKGKCIYCATSIGAESKKHGTSSMRNHVLNCSKNPTDKSSRQQLLTFEPAPNASATASESNMGVMGTWKFDQDFVRNALAKMIATDELPIRFVEGEGFRKFMSVACPRFKFPYRWTCTRDISNIFVEERQKLKSFFKSNCQRVCLTTDSWTSI